ncbi:MAG: AAA domain-containing protein [Planctomycetota bacterium]
MKRKWAKKSRVDCGEIGIILKHMNLSEKIIQAVSDSGIQGATLGTIHRNVDAAVSSRGKLRVLLRQMVVQGDLRFHRGRYFVENEAVIENNLATPALGSSGDFDFDDLRKVCQFYAAVVDRVRGSDLEFAPEDPALESELIGSLDWGLLSRQPIRIRRELLPNRGSDITGGNATFCGPFERVSFRNNREAWLPIFVIQAKVERTASELVFEQLDEIEVNTRWLDHHVRNEEARMDLLIRMGFAEERNGEFFRVPCENLNAAWNYLSQNVSEIRWQRTGALSTLHGPQGFRNEQRLGVYPGVLCLPWSKPGFGWGEIMEELKEISEQTDETLKKTALHHYLSPAPANNMESGESNANIISLDPLNHIQGRALSRSKKENLVVIQGPPGTGKSTVVRNMVLNQSYRQESVLFCSQNHRALEAVVPAVNSTSDNGLFVFDARSSPSGSNWVQQLSRNLNGNYPQQVMELSELKEKARTLAVEVESRKQALLDAQVLRDQYTEASLLLSGVRSEIGQEAEILENINLPISYEAYRSAFRTDEFRWYKIHSWLNEWKRQIIIRKLVSINSEIKKLGRDTLFKFSILLSAKEKALSLEAKIREAKSLTDLSERISNLEEEQEPIIAKLADLIPCEYSHAVQGYHLKLQNISNAHRRKKRDRRRYLATCRDNLPDLLPGMPAWACTNQSVASRIPMVPGLFDLCVIDEAAQCDPISVIPLLYRSRRAVIVGDPMQLPPTSSIGSEKEDHIRQQFDIMESRFDRFMTSGKASAYDIAQGATRANHSDETMLREHYRCHPQIASFFNDEFYAGNLIVRTRTSRGRFDGPRIRWTHVQGGMERVAGSYWWGPQCETIIDTLKELARNGYEGTVGVVTPFHQNAKRIQDQAFFNLSTSQLEDWEFLCGTADKFQGAEKDLILFGMIGGGSGPNPTPQFYSRELRRFNVALSRAKGSLHIFGDQNWAKCCGVPVIENLFDYVESLETQQNALSSETRTDLIGPVWEPLLAEKLGQYGIEYVPQYYSCGYYLDFALFRNEQKINIEVDGETYHRDKDGALRQEDVSRDQILKADGWRIKRFWVYELREDIDKCMRTIQELLG